MMETGEESEHFVQKEVHLSYTAELANGELEVNDKLMNEREAGCHHFNEFDYGEYFYCTCGERFWKKEEARDHLLQIKGGSE